MTILEVVAAVGLAVCPPFVYAEQAWRIQERRDSRGFAKEVCGVLLCANGARVLWWFGVHYELALLAQAILMIAAQIFLLHLCLKFRSGTFASAAYSVSSSDRPGAVLFDNGQGTGAGRPPIPQFQFRVDPPPEEQEGQGHHAPSHSLNRADCTSFLSSSQEALNDAGRRLAALPQLGIQSLQTSGPSSRPLSFWDWQDFSTYILVFGGYMVVLALLQAVLGWSQTYNGVLGTWAMGIEALLPIPQLVINQQRKSLSGFQMTVLAGWTFGDLFKTFYYLWRDAPLQFTIFGAFQLTVDLAICAQAYYFHPQTLADDASQAAEHGQSGQGGQGAPEHGPSPDQRAPSPQRPPSRNPEEELELLPADVSDDEDGKKPPSRKPLPKSQPFEVGDIESDE